MPRTTKKGAIVDAALALFVEKGIDGTTTKEIAAQAGTAEGNIYRHFKGKDDLAFRMFRDNTSLFLKYLEYPGVYEDGPKTALSRLIAAFIRFWVEQPHAYEYVMRAHQTQFPRLAKDMMAPKDVFVIAIGRGIEMGIFRQMDAHLAAAMVIGMIVRTIFFKQHRLISHSVRDMEAELSRAVGLILAA